MEKLDWNGSGWIIRSERTNNGNVKAFGLMDKHTEKRNDIGMKKIKKQK